MTYMYVYLASIASNSNYHLACRGGFYLNLRHAEGTAVSLGRLGLHRSSPKDYVVSLTLGVDAAVPHTTTSVSGSLWFKDTYIFATDHVHASDRCG